jgi:PAS domain S-box-containing protein
MLHDKKALPTSQGLIQLLAESIPGLLYIYDLEEDRNIYCNHQTSAMLGYTPAEIQQMGSAFWQTIMHPEDWAKVPGNLVTIATFKDNEVFEWEYRVKSDRGDWRWLLGRDTIFMRNSDGKVKQILGTAIDISGRKQTEIAFQQAKEQLEITVSERTAELSLLNRQLRLEITERQRVEAALRDSEKRLKTIVTTLCDSEARLQTIVGNLLDGLLIVNRSGRVLFANPAAGKIFNCEPEDLIDVELGWPNAENGTIELTILRPGKEIGIGEMHVASAQWEGQSVCIVSLRDITARKRAEKALRDSEERFRQMAENIADVFWLASPVESQILYISPAYEQIWGRSREDLYVDPRSWLDTIYPEDRPIVLASIAKQLHGESTSTEYRIIQPDGTVRWIWARGFPIKHESGNLYRIAGIAEDISDRKLAEAQIQASLQEKEVLLKEIHHRVKNNMQVISSLLELQSQYIDDPQTITLFQESQHRIRSMALIHEQLYHSLLLERIDFAKYIKDLAMNLFQVFGNQGNAIALKLNVAAISLNIETAIPCGLIINELVSNSLKYAFPNGKQGEIRIIFEQINAQQFHLSVSDNGVGLPPNFNLETTETLGVRLVRMLTRQLKGVLEVDREQGTRLKITFSELNYCRRV